MENCLRYYMRNQKTLNSMSKRNRRAHNYRPKEERLEGISLCFPSFHPLLPYHFTDRETEAEWLPCCWKPVPTASMRPAGIPEGAEWRSGDRAPGGSEVMEGIWGWGGEAGSTRGFGTHFLSDTAVRDRGRSELVPALIKHLGEREASAWINQGEHMACWSQCVPAPESWLLNFQESHMSVLRHSH